MYIAFKAGCNYNGNYIKSKKPIGWKKRSISSKAQKKTNKITKFMSNVFL